MATILIFAAVLIAIATVAVLVAEQVRDGQSRLVDVHDPKPQQRRDQDADVTTGLILDANKRLIVQGGTVKIVRTAGLFAAEREKVLPISKITSVELKKPGLFIVGFIQFSIGGGNERSSSYTLSGGAFDAVTDENSVVFSGEENYRLAVSIRDYIEQYQRREERGTDPTNSVADEILKLKALADEGILTSEEFNQKKKQLLTN